MLLGGLLWFALGFQMLPAAGGEPVLLAHYMPWYATKDISGAWGWHWTMNHFQPDRLRWEGQREAASHDYPLIGLYDSADDHALECQVLLMKFAGLHGVIIDWYGTRNLNDYAANHRRTEKLVPWLRKAGLRFAICYEDQALKQLGAGEDLNQAALDLQWAEKNWFGDPAYVTHSNRPVLLVFGPQHLKPQQWTQLRGKLVSKPMIFALPHLAKSHGADGAFGWPPVTGGRKLSPEQWRKELEALYSRKAGGESLVGTVFPGFKDIYREAGVHDSYGAIEHRRGETFAETLEMALQSGVPIIQIATWNDYGEGTVIEPTRSQGYRYLEQLQRQSPSARGRNVADLRLPVVLYQLRKRSAGDAAINADLNRAAAELFSARCGEAEAVLDSVGRSLGQRPAVFHDTPAEADAGYRLRTELLYREGAGLSDAMRQRCRLDVYSPVTNQPFSTVVYFHGGGMTEGERSIPLPLRRKGLAVVSVNYRLVPGVKAPVFIEDAAAAVAWTLQHIAEFGGSPDRVFVSGHSAGGYLTAMLGLDKRWLAAHGLDANRIAGLIPLSPQAITHFIVRAERGISDRQPVVDDLAPLFHVRKDAPPMLLITGDREKELVGRYEENAYFWRMMKVVGHRETEVRELPGFNHGNMPEPAFPFLLEFVRQHSGAAVGGR